MPKTKVLIYLEPDVNAKLSLVATHYNVSRMHLAGDFVRMGVEQLYIEAMREIEEGEEVEVEVQEPPVIEIYDFTSAYDEQE